MTSLARKLHFLPSSAEGPSRPVTQEVGEVETAGALRVRTESGSYAARRAVSCLVAPLPGDLVLVARPEAEHCYILAVLERPEEGAAVVLESDGDLTIRPRGRMAVAAQEGVTIASGKDLSVASASVDVKTVDASVSAQRLGVVGRFLHSEIDRVKTVAGVIDEVAERISQRVKRLYRHVEDFEQLRADKVDYVANKTMSLRGQNTLMTAEELVKVDGEQIHLG
ncbi:MAG: DUF3540 domain-containing protein [Myxococcales bacterium]|nr:DUF3540 domain-containing protein [Myxococcales bacterium]